MSSFQISEQAIDGDALKHSMRHDQAGAFVCFEGWGRNHHAGQAGHGHFMNALRKILRLTDGGVAIDLRCPDNCAGPNKGEYEPDGGGQALHHGANHIQR